MVRADAFLIITTDRVQNGGMLTINPAAELVVHGPANPMLTMTNNAFRYQSGCQLALNSVPEPTLGSLMLGSLILLRRRMHGLPR